MIISGKEALEKNVYNQIFITDFENKIDCRVLSNKIETTRILEKDNSYNPKEIAKMFLQNNKIKKIYVINAPENDVKLFVAASENEQKFVISYQYKNKKYSDLIANFINNYQINRQEAINSNNYQKIELISSKEESSFRIIECENKKILQLKVLKDEKEFIIDLISQIIDETEIEIKKKRNNYHPGYKLSNEKIYISVETNLYKIDREINEKIKDHNIKVRKLKEND